MVMSDSARQEAVDEAMARLVLVMETDVAKRITGDETEICALRALPNDLFRDAPSSFEAHHKAETRANAARP